MQIKFSTVILRKLLVSSALLISILSHENFVTAQDGNMDNFIDSKSSKIAKDVKKWRRHLHENPELSSEEFKTAKYVESLLKKFGLNPQNGVAKTGVVAVLQGGLPGPTVAIRADMDALPILEETGLKFSSKNKGVMHACGHDFHTSILLGVAKLLSERKKDIPGTIKFIFQPAEEAPSGQLVGARLMVDEGVLKNPDIEAINGPEAYPRVPTSRSVPTCKPNIASTSGFLRTPSSTINRAPTN